MSHNGFSRNTRYYSGTVYEWNLPAGWTCPFALGCKVKVGRETGKFRSNGKGSFRCYAANAERFPSCRESRWKNYEAVTLGGSIPDLPAKAKAVRIHASGDFFTAEYMEQWFTYACDHPDVEFWAFTKSVEWWVDRLGKVPRNLVLTASYGGTHDFLIGRKGLKSCRVYKSRADVPDGVPIDTNDDLARTPDRSFALLDNHNKEHQHE